MFKKLFRIVFLLTLLAAALGFLLWRELGGLIRVAQNELPPEYLFSFEQHYIDQQGQLVLTNPLLSHGNYGIIFRAQSLTFKPDDWMEMWSLEENIILGNYLPKGAFTLNDFTIPVEQLAKSVKSESEFKFLGLLAQGCGNKSDFSFSDLVEAGTSNLTGNLELAFEYTGSAANLKVQSSVKIEQFSALETQVELNDVQAGTDTSPYLVYAQWIIFDPEFIKTRNEYCAGLNQQSIAEFKTHHLEQAIAYVENQGLVLSDSVKKHYQRFVEQPENIAFTFSPNTGIRLQEYSNLDWVTYLDKLGVSLNINGRAVKSIFDRKQTEIEQAEKQKQEAAKQPEQPHSNIIRSPALWQFRSHVGERIHLVDENDKNYTGRIISVTSRVVKLEIRQSGGYATLRFKPGQIRSIEKVK